MQIKRNRLTEQRCNIDPQQAQKAEGRKDKCNGFECLQIHVVLFERFTSCFFMIDKSVRNRCQKGMTAINVFVDCCTKGLKMRGFASVDVQSPAFCFASEMRNIGYTLSAAKQPGLLLLARKRTPSARQTRSLTPTLSASEREKCDWFSVFVLRGYGDLKTNGF